jgi:hypothetical protein
MTLRRASGWWAAPLVLVLAIAILGVALHSHSQDDTGAPGPKCVACAAHDQGAIREPATPLPVVLELGVPRGIESTGVPLSNAVVLPPSRSPPATS